MGTSAGHTSPVDLAAQARRLAQLAVRLMQTFSGVYPDMSITRGRGHGGPGVGGPAGEWEFGCYYKCLYPQAIPDTAWAGEPVHVPPGTVFYSCGVVTREERSPLGDAFVTELDYLRLGCLNTDLQQPERFRFLHIAWSKTLPRHSGLWQKLVSPLILLALQESDLALLSVDYPA